MTRKRKSFFHFEESDAPELAQSFRRIASRSRLDALRSARLTVRMYATSAREVSDWHAVIDGMIAEESARGGKVA